MQDLINNLKALGTRRLVIRGAALFGIGALAFLLVLRITAPVMAPLYANLGLDASRPIVERLEALQIPYEVRANGATILVPENQVATLQLSLAGLLATAAIGTEGATAGPRDLGARRAAHEDQLRRQIEAMLAEIVGFDNVRAAVSVELSFNRTTTSSESFDPDSQIESSTTLVEEFPPNQSGRPNPIRSEQKTDYEIAKTTRTETIEPGDIRKLSAVVLIDGAYGPDTSGDVVYQPRSQADLDRWTALVRSTIGFDANRGDSLELVNIQFASASGQELGTSTFPLLGMSRQGFQSLFELILLAGLLVFVMALFSGPLLQGRWPGFWRLVPAGGPSPGSAALGEVATGLAQSEAAAGADKINEVGRIMAQNPEEAAAIVRKWLNSN